MLRCRFCKTERYYLIEELRVAFGNIECDDVPYRNNWRCTKCGQRNMIDLTIVDPSAAELQKIKLRPPKSGESIQGKFRFHLEPTGLLEIQLNGGRWAAELQGQTVRRLVAIKILRRPVWRDEPS